MDVDVKPPGVFAGGPHFSVMPDSPAGLVSIRIDKALVRNVPAAGAEDDDPAQPVGTRPVSVDWQASQPANPNRIALNAR